MVLSAGPCLGTAGNDRVEIKVGLGYAGCQAIDLGGPQVTLVIAIAKSGFKGAAIGPAVRVCGGGKVCTVFLVVRVGAVPFVCRKRCRGSLEPSSTKKRFVVVVQVVQAEHELISSANT